MKVNNKNKRGRCGPLSSSDTLKLEQYFLSGGSQADGCVGLKSTIQ